MKEIMPWNWRIVRIKSPRAYKEIGPILQQQAALGNTGLEERERINPTIEHEHYWEFHTSFHDFSNSDKDFFVNLNLAEWSV